jgi:predicted nucleic acid-binding Zn ribbon protein
MSVASEGQDERELMPRLSVSPEAARAPVAGAPASARDRQCPICSDPLRPRQQVCSGRCRAERSRRRQAEARQARDQAVRALLFAALDLIGKDPQQ